MTPTVWVYSTQRNESALLPYWLRHYKTFASRVIVYDGDSDDGSPDLIRSAGGEVRKCGFTLFDEQGMQALHNAQYREARGRADWIMWVDGDEFMYHPHMLDRLAELTTDGVTVARVQGYSMYAPAPPSGSGQIYEELPLGVAESDYSKPQIINPQIELDWGIGRDPRASNVTSAVREDEDHEPIKLLHYRWLGRAYFDARNAANYKRYINPSYESNRRQVAPDWDGKYSGAWYEQQMLKATRVV